MDYTFTADELAFRQEVADLVDAELGDERHETYETGEVQTERERSLLRALSARGWLVPTWPVRYGGAGLSLTKQFILNQELGYSGTGRPRGVGAGIVGPAMLVYGTEEQKERFLPPIARAEEVWCQGFSEAGAGSDLASLQCRAIRDGDTYVINGTKMWTSFSHFADWIMLLVRTDPDAPKHRGISCLLVERRAPGITLNPYLTMMNQHHFNEVIFDNVRVPVSALLGEENRGWYVATTALDYERSGIGAMSGFRRSLDDMVQQWQGDHNELQANIRAAQRGKLAEIAIQLQVGTQLSYRVAWMQSRGRIPNHEASMAKVFGSEVGRELYNTAVGLQGLYGDLAAGTVRAKLDGRMQENRLYNIIMNIAAGSSEIQRNIIATRGLGLPRG